MWVLFCMLRTSMESLHLQPAKQHVVKYVFSISISIIFIFWKINVWIFADLAFLNIITFYGMLYFSYIYLFSYIFTVHHSASSSVRESVQLLCHTLQSVPVLQVTIVTLGHSIHSIQQTPAAAGNHCSAVTVSCKKSFSPTKINCV